MRLFKKRYSSILNEQKRSVVAVPVVEAIPSIKRGKPLTIGELDGVVQSYIKALREPRTPFNASLVIASANGIVSSKDRSLLAENGGTIFAHPGPKPWMGEVFAHKDGLYVKRNYTTSCAGKKLTPRRGKSALCHGLVDLLQPTVFQKISSSILTKLASIWFQ